MNLIAQPLNISSISSRLSNCHLHEWKKKTHLKSLDVSPSQCAINKQLYHWLASSQTTFWKSRALFRYVRYAFIIFFALLFFPAHEKRTVGNTKIYLFLAKSLRTKTTLPRRRWRKKRAIARGGCVQHKRSTNLSHHKFIMARREEKKANWICVCAKIWNLWLYNGVVHKCREPTAREKKLERWKHTLKKWRNFVKIKRVYSLQCSEHWCRWTKTTI